LSVQQLLSAQVQQDKINLPPQLVFDGGMLFLLDVALSSAFIESISERNCTSPSWLM